MFKKYFECNKIKKTVQHQIWIPINWMSNYPYFYQPLINIFWNIYWFSISKEKSRNTNQKNDNTTENIWKVKNFVFTMTTTMETLKRTCSPEYVIRYCLIIMFQVKLCNICFFNFTAPGLIPGKFDKLLYVNYENYVLLL